MVYHSGAGGSPRQDPNPNQSITELEMQPARRKVFFLGSYVRTDDRGERPAPGRLQGLKVSCLRVALAILPSTGLTPMPGPSGTRTVPSVSSSMAGSIRSSA